MPNNNHNRVLGCRNARHLGTEELHNVLGKGNSVLTLHFTSPFFHDE